MQRLLYAINHKSTEDKITEQIKDKIICVGAVTYKEAVLSGIQDNHADVVLIRDTLGGHMKIEDLIRTIRLQCPLVRIVFLSSSRRKGDGLISTLIGYGIYDIIISDSVSIQAIVSYLLEPRNFRDVAAYYKPLAFEEPEEEEEKTPKKSGFSLFRPKKAIPEKPTAEIKESAAPTADLEALRSAIEEEANRKAQVNIQKVIDKEVESKTKELRRQLQETEAALSSANSSLNGQLKNEATAGRELNDARNRIVALEKESADKTLELERVKREYEASLRSTQTTKDPEWFLKRSQELESEIEKLKQELKESKEKEGSGGVQVDYAMDGRIILPDLDQYTATDPSDNHVFLFMGAKHGVGTTTAALNAATVLASTGQKVLLIELNSKYPMLNQYFEFTNLTAGVDTACAGMSNGNFKAMEAAIIKPHGLSPANRALGKTYAKLPGGLHFMLLSNTYLLAQKNGRANLEATALKDLIYASLIQLKYSYIIVDVQPDERDLYETCVNAGFASDKLVLVLSQDPHALASAGYLLTDIAKSPSGKLIKNATYLIDQAVNGGLDTKKIAKYLSVDAKQMLAISSDREGHMKAATSGLPYIFQNGPCEMEYRALAEKIKR